jgi:hypothetical protein
MNHVDRGDQLRSYTTYEYRFRRGPWQALLWGFLLDVVLVNRFILQLKSPHPHWKPYTTLKDWKECIYNAIFNRYAGESQARKRNRTGMEEDIEDDEARQKHLQRDINHVFRDINSACLACKGFRQGQPRPFKKGRQKEAIYSRYQEMHQLREPDTTVKYAKWQFVTMRSAGTSTTRKSRCVQKYLLFRSF